MRSATVALLVIVSLLAFGCEPMSQAELGREIDGLRSLAAEGAVLADQVAAQRTKRTFARVQARELSDSAEHSAERLTDAHPAEGLNDPLDRAVQLADEISAALGDLEVAPDDAEAAAQGATRLRQLADQAERLRGSL